MSLNFRNIVQYCFCQEKDLEKTETKVAVAEEEEIREEAGSVKVTPVWSQQDFLKVKVQKSSFDMLRTLQWTGCTRYIEEEKLALACPEGRLGVLQYVKMLVFSCCVRASKSLCLHILSHFPGALTALFVFLLHVIVIWSACSNDVASCKVKI